MKKNLLPFLLSVLFVVGEVAVHSQTRVAVLPIRNQVGDIALNVYSIGIADSIRVRLQAADSTSFELIPPEEVELAIAQYNLDPTNPQYVSDVWKAVAELKAVRVVTGQFQMMGPKMMLNVYVYDVATKLADKEHAATDIFKNKDRIYETIGQIVEMILPALQKK